MNYTNKILNLLLLIKLIYQANALIGYDCGTKALNVTVVSLLEVGECDIPEINVKSESKVIQLLQVVDYHDTMVTQCKVLVRRTVYDCGFFGHMYPVPNGVQEYLQEITGETCLEMQRHGVYRYDNQIKIHKLKTNETQFHGVELAGSAEGNKCNGGPYTDPYGNYRDVYVAGTFTISIFHYRAQVNLDKNKIHLKTGVTCPFSDTQCMDPIAGYTFWNALPEDRCHYDKYNIIYEGKATKLIDSDMPNAKPVYTLVTDDITFALTSKNIENVCGFDIIATEHPRLYIFEKHSGSLFTRKTKSAENLDIFTYVNSKFVYIEKHIRSQMKDLYRDLVMQRCLLERETIKNSLAISIQNPDEYAFNLLKGGGHMAYVAGEVVYIIKCIPVEVRIDQSEECYTQLRVSWNNETWFLTPRTHILIRRGTQIGCNAALAPYYRIGNLWYKATPKLTETIAPHIMNPTINASWTYKNPASLATSGIYSDKDLDQLREHLSFPMEVPSLLNSLARNIVGKPTVHNGASFINLLDEDSFEKIAEGAWSKIWTKFLTFGTVSAGIIAILLILQFFKLLIDTVIRGYTLHSIYGWSIHLLGAIFASITSLLIHLGKTKKETSDAENPKTVELQPKPKISPIETVNSNPSTSYHIPMYASSSYLPPHFQNPQ